MKDFNKIVEEYIKTEVLKENCELIQCSFNGYDDIWYRYRDNSLPAKKRLFDHDSNVFEDTTCFGTKVLFVYMIRMFAELNEKIDKLNVPIPQ